MNHKERVYAAFYGEEPDVVPSWHWLFTGCHREFFGDELSRMGDWKKQQLFLSRFLDDDMIGGIWPFIRKILVRTDDMVIVQSGFGEIIYYKYEPDWVMTVAPAVRYPEDLDRIEPPDASVLDDMWFCLGGGLFPTHKTSVKELVKTFGDEYYLELQQYGPFQAVWFYLRGMENWMMDIVKNPSFAKKLVECVMKPQIEVGKAAIEAGIDGILISDDMANASGPWFSAKVYREFFKPWVKRMADEYHKAGGFLAYHSDGNVNLLMDDMVDTGVDCINPLCRDEGMVLADFKKKYGNRTACLGGAHFGLAGFSPEQLEAHVKELIETGAPGGGYVYRAPIHDLSREQVYHYQSLLRKYRREYAKKKM
jgi:uroporphyrinogen decarboxylase